LIAKLSVNFTLTEFLARNITIKLTNFNSLNGLAWVVQKLSHVLKKWFVNEVLKAS
jgi:hypothetical protein